MQGQTPVWQTGLAYGLEYKKIMKKIMNWYILEFFCWIISPIYFDVWFLYCLGFAQQICLWKKPTIYKKPPLHVIICLLLGYHRLSDLFLCDNSNHVGGKSLHLNWEDYPFVLLVLIALILIHLIVQCK